MVKQKDRHRWLRDALTDKGLRQKDLATRWQCDEAVVSRFIKTGEPELTYPRFEALTQILGIDRNELAARLAERPIPTKETYSHEPEPAPAPHRDGAAPHLRAAPDVRAVLDALRDAVDAAQRALPAYRITVTIEASGDSLGLPPIARTLQVGDGLYHGGQ